MAAAYQPTEADRELVETLAGYGVPAEGIAKLLKISRPLVFKYFPEELEIGTLKANVAVAGNLFRLATGDGKSAAVSAMFWLKTRARWREVPQEVEVKVQSEASVEDRARALALMLAKRGDDDERRPH